MRSQRGSANWFSGRDLQMDGLSAAELSAMSGDGGMAGGLPTYCVLDATEVEVEAAALSGVADVICFDAHDPKDVPDSVESCDAVRVSNPFPRSTHPSRSSPRGVSDTCTHASPCSAPSIPSALVPRSIPFHTSRYSHTHTHTRRTHSHHIRPPGRCLALHLPRRGADPAVQVVPGHRAHGRGVRQRGYCRGGAHGDRGVQHTRLW